MGVFDDLTPTPAVNKYAGIILAFVAGSTVVGYIVDNLVCRKALKGAPEDRPRGWVLGMLISSYFLLLPGLFHTLFGYRIAVMGGMKVLSERKENTIQFAHELLISGSELGCVFVVGFAIVLPIAKFILLVVGGILRHSRSSGKRSCARKSVMFVQRISKWASPDMFAYILLTYLIRGLNKPPILIGLMDLDIGFTCFATFCVASTISSLGVRAPTKGEVGMDDGEPKTGFGFKPLPALVCTVVVCIVFVVMLVLGITRPCMALRLDMDLLFQSGKVDISLKPLVEAMHIQELAADDVTLWNCTKQLFEWIRPDAEDNREHWEVNSAVAFFLLSVLVIAFTVLDMLVLLMAAVFMQVTRRRPPVLLEVAMFLRKLSMLDVCVTGVFIIILAGRIYRANGVIVRFQEGWLYLLIAELCHYIAYWAVTLTGRFAGLRDARRDSFREAPPSDSSSSDGGSEGEEDR